MGQKVNPHGLRVGVIKDWDSRWYAREDKVGDLVVEDYNIRKYLKSTLYSAGIAKIEIERDNANKVRINIHCSRPGVVIGKGGSEIEKLRLKLEAMLKKPVNVNIVEVRSPDMNAQLVAENIAAQLEKRIGYRRAMKKAMQNATRLGAKGIKVTAALKSLAARPITRAPFPCRPSVLTLTTVSPRPTPLTVRSALRFGSTRARFSTPRSARPRLSSPDVIAETMTVVAIAAATETTATEITAGGKEATANASA